VNVVRAELDGVSGDELLDLTDRLKQRHAPAAVVAGSRADGTATLVLNFDNSLEARGLNAGAVIKEAAALIGGGGGGRPTMARAGGKQPERLGEALDKAQELISAALS
ncbi:MAG TPA: DHHA1 domain-containing protein, partial [Gaiellaceae bacterium]|nr:DHHA1 domain-containing protein [Gaiellaceae bacterium]